MTKEQIINTAVDIFGYSDTDFDGMSYREVVTYLEDQMEEIKQFLEEAR